MTSPSVSRPRARLSVGGESDGRLAMRCTWQPMGRLACDVERNARRLARRRVDLRVVVLLHVLGRQSNGHALPSWRGLQACGSSSLATAVVKVASTDAYPRQRSLEPSPGRMPYTVSAPK